MSKISSNEVVADPVVDETATKPDSEVQPVDLTLGMDGTAIIEFSFVDNIRYSEEIITNARTAFDMEKLAALKGDSDLREFYAEGKKQILSQWHADQALAAHSNLFRVLLQINAGEILNLIEPTFKKKGEYMKWVRETFELKHFRYLQQARQLADMGDYGKTHAAVGKNRLLALEALRRVEKKESCNALLTEHPLPDTTEDEEGALFKRHIDSVITLHRLLKAEIPFVTFEQASQIASYESEALSVKKAGQIKKWLDQNPEDQRQSLLDRYIQDQMTYPSDHKYTPAPKASLDKILADLVNSFGTGKLQDDAWITKQRELKVMNSLLAAQQLIAQLIERIGVDAPAVDTTETSSKTQTV